MPSLTPLAFAALGLLAEGPTHPYEMFQTMTHRRDGRNVKVRPGTLYHQVGRLVELGLAEIVGTDRAGNRPERTTYAITDDGWTALHDGLVRLIAEPAEMPVALVAVPISAKPLRSIVTFEASTLMPLRVLCPLTLPVR